MKKREDNTGEKRNRREAHRIKEMEIEICKAGQQAEN